MRLKPAFLVAFIALTGFSFAAPLSPSDLVPACIAGLLAAGIIAIMFMLAKFLQDAQLEASAKDMLREVIAGVVVVAIVFAIASGAIAMMPALTGQSSASVDTIVVGKIGDLNSGYIGNLTADFETAIRVSNRIGMISSYYYSRTLGYIFYFGAMQSPFQGMAGLRISLTHLSNEIANGIIIYETIKMLYYFLSSISGLVFAIGFALRIVPFTRKAGGMVMAIAFAAAVLFPYATYLSTLLHDQIILDAASQNVKIHSQITPADLDKITLKLPSFLVEMCTNDFIRVFTALNEWGWWAIICIPYCTIILVATLIAAAAQCAASAASCLVGYAACYAACYLPQASEAYASFASCIVPIYGNCWESISYPLYNGVQSAFTLASTIATTVAAKSIEGQIGGNVGEIYDIVVQKLVMPVSAAAAMPAMEGVFIGGIVIAGARSLSGTFGGDIQIVGLGRLV